MFNVSELENVPNFAETFDCKDGEVFAVNFVELQGKVNISRYAVFMTNLLWFPYKATQVQFVILSIAYIQT